MRPVRSGSDNAVTGDGDQHAPPAAGVDAVVGLGDLVERAAVADVDGEGSDGGRGGEIAGSLASGPGGEVVAAEHAEGDVGEQQGPEGEFGAVGAGGVGGDDRVVRDHRGVQVGVVRQGHLDDAVDAPRCVRADRPGRVVLVEGDGVGHHGGVDAVQVFAVSHRGEDGGPAPAGELGGQ